MPRGIFSAIAIVYLAVAGPAGAQVRTIELVPGSPALAVVGQSGSEVAFRVDVRQLQTVPVTTREGSFTRLLIPGFHGSQRVGAPELPMMNRLLALPLGCRPRIEVRSLRSRDLDLGAHGVTTPLWPVQPPVSKSPDADAPPFAYDRAVYQAARIAQDLVKVVPLGRLRAMDMGRVEVSPVEYFPAENRVRVHEEIEFKIVFEEADPRATSDLLARTHSPYFEVVYGQVANALSFHDSYPDHVRDVVTMAVVTPPDFAAQLAEFVAWKTRRGFHVVVGVIGDPEVGTTTDTIGAWLQSLYENATPDLPAPSFVLFVGDVAQMPTFSIGGDPTDRPYCCVDGDLMPDMYYGRLPAANSEQLQAILDKTMMYDQFTMPDPSYLEKAVMIAGVDATYASVWANGQIYYGVSNYFNAAHGIASNTYYYPASGSSDAQIIANASEGRAYINYTAHGSKIAWSDPTFTQADVNGLANDGEYGLVVGNCCLTGCYDWPECFGETWLRAPHKGAIGYVGASNNSYWDEDYWWGVGYRAVIVAQPTYDSGALGAYDGLFHDHGEDMSLWYVTNDALVFCGNLAVTQAGSSLTEYYWNIYNLLGDPSLSPYLGVPYPNPVAHPAEIAASSVSLPVWAVPNSYIGLTQGGALVGAGTTDATGAATLAFTQTALISGEPLHIVVTAQNRVPYEADIAVTDGDVLDACANPNGAIPDNDPAGITSTLAVPDVGVIDDIQVYVNITHPRRGDLLVQLISPTGVVVTLHDVTTEETDDLVGWYPVQLTPSQPLSALVGQGMQGDWLLTVSDRVATNLGVLNEWCLRITHFASATGVGDGLPSAAVVLFSAWPNPFNPSARIALSLPRALDVDLAVYDVSGRRIVTLGRGEWSAGRHEVDWNGRDARGRAVPSGAYFFRLAADGRALVRKAVLLK